MISLTLVRSSSGFHGTVGRTIGFWNARYGLESLHLRLHFYFNGTISKCEGCFLSTPVKTNIFCRFLVCDLWNRRLTFVVILFCYIVNININNIIFSRSQRFFYPSPDCFPSIMVQGMQLHSMPGSSEYLQIAKKSKISVLWDKNFSKENRHIPSYAVRFSIPETFRNPQRFPYKVFQYSQTKIFDENSWKPCLA